MELSQDTLLAILAAVLIADVVVVAVALIWTQVQRRRTRDDLVAPPPVQPSNRPTPGATPVMSRPFPAASASSTPTNAYGAAGSGYSAGMPVAPGAPGAPGYAAAASPSPTYGSGGPAYGNAGGPTSGLGVPGMDPTIDTLTGLLTAGAWSRTVVDEEARIRRYHRPATIVVVEVEGLDRLVSRLGPGSVERIVPAVADTIRRGAREADHVARLATGRFAVLMPETDEILAINYIERIRKACDLWLESGAVSLRLAIGWASSTGDGSLVDAEALATDRMYVELRRVTRGHAQVGSVGVAAGVGDDAGADGGPGSPLGG
jgi:diguanylate cyclase (GGDEF)-like protein